MQKERILTLRPPEGMRRGCENIVLLDLPARAWDGNRSLKKLIKDEEMNETYAERFLRDNVPSGSSPIA